MGGRLHVQFVGMKENSTVSFVLVTFKLPITYCKLGIIRLELTKIGPE